MLSSKCKTIGKCLVFILNILIFSSCASQKNIAYFNDLPNILVDSVIKSQSFSAPVILSDDVLLIDIQTVDASVNSLINSGNKSGTTGLPASNESLSLLTGYLVDKSGNVEIPMLGSVKLAGLTTTEAKELIVKRASIYFKNPIVQVRFGNYRITVLGEVLRPSTFTIANERVSVLDALGLAGDLTVYGRRENVLLIRDKGFQKEITRLNLNSSDLFKSPYFYLKQNDVIYVEPGKSKAAATNAARTQTLAILGSVLSVLIVALSRF